MGVNGTNVKVRMFIKKLILKNNLINLREVSNKCFWWLKMVQQMLLVVLTELGTRQLFQIRENDKVTT